ncbi:MAG: sigma 54-interacting transcriptional regulator [Bacillota bacterium]|nr:sigma 54-interacting transcriptional regulator [Bacillota bacterium]
MKEIESTITINDLLPIFDCVTDAIFIDDGSGICHWCNDACEDMYNINIEEIQGKTVDELEKQGIFSPSVTKRVLDEKREITIMHRNRDGKMLLTTGTPIFDAESAGRQISLIITTSRDITQFSQTSGDSRPTKSILGASPFKSTEQYDPANAKKIIARSEAMQNVMMLAKRLASVNTTVLITGESGVGKGLIAKTLHDEGNRWKGPFVTVNCGAIPETLIESELFGYVAGAFTGSRSGGKKGLFEAAQGGTIFLDEISELPLNLQVKLLQVIQERQITPVGSTEAIPVDVRIISATNKDLEVLVKEGKFREDLYYRLNVVPISVPPLRQRHDDILPLIRLNLAKFNKNLGENKTISSDALSILIKYPWPGNIRELQNIVERLIITTSHDVISSDDIFEFIKKDADQNTSFSLDLSLAAAMEQAEKEILRQALDNYKSTRAIAKVLQVSQPTIVRKLNKYGLTKA